MRSVWLLALVSFGGALVFTPLVRWLSIRFGLVDAPDAARKLHSFPVPRTGGVVIAASFVSGFALLLATPAMAGHLVHSAVPVVGRLLPAAALMFFSGLVDDILGLKPLHKL